MSVKKNVTDANNNVFSNKISLDVMKSIWNEKDKIYTDEQLLKMREWVYILMEVIFKAAKNANENCNSKLIDRYEKEESNIVC